MVDPINNKQWLPIAEADLLCKIGCGYYGNPQWDGYCSKCWREYQNEQRRQLHRESAGQALGFSRFEEKKRAQTDRKSTTLKSILKKSPSKDERSFLSLSNRSNSLPQQQHISTSKKPELTPEILSARENFMKWGDGLSKQLQPEIKRFVSQIIEKSFHLLPEQMTEFIQDVYNSLQEKLNKAQLPEDAILQFEAYICVRLYKQLFCPPQDEEQDLALQSRIRSLNWVCHGFLESGFNLDISKVRDHIHLAITKLIELNNKHSPGDKLDCIVSCALEVMAALQVSRGGPASADEFLPALIHVLIDSNPPLLQSNVNFITRYACQSRLLTGEQAYYFTNLCCAVSFIQQLNCESIRLSSREFDDYMSGKLIPPMRRFTTHSDGLDRLQTLLEELYELDKRSDKFLDDLAHFQTVMSSNHQDIMNEIEKFNKSHPCRAWEPLSIDSNLSPEKERELPRPLLPSQEN